MQEGLHPGWVYFQGVCIQWRVCIQGVGRLSPEIQGILRDTVNKRAVHILLECILVSWFNLIDCGGYLNSILVLNGILMS